MLFDTHAHLNDDKFEPDRDEMIKKSFDEGITLIMNPGADMKSSQGSVLLSQKHEFIYCAVGIHPHSVEEMDEKSIEMLADLAKDKKVRAIGEIGLDYFRDLSPREIQRQKFIEQIDLAKQLRLPIIVHDRESHGDVLSILKKENIKQIGGILHSFSGSLEMAVECIKLGMEISISGPVTFANNRKTIEVVQGISLEHLLIETDSPYLTPVPFRGKRNYPGLVKYVAEKISEIKGIKYEEVGRVTFENGKRIFRI